MNEQTHRRAFAVTVVICILLAAALGFVILRQDHNNPAPEANPVVARGPAADNQATAAKGTATEGPPSTLTPVQLSPQRLQAIGVETAVVEWKVVDDKLRVPGNVDINEQQLSYVQTRFPGWIQKVFANAAYQYVRKGQPLLPSTAPNWSAHNRSTCLPSKTSSLSPEGCMEPLPRKVSGWCRLPRSA